MKSSGRQLMSAMLIACLFLFAPAPPAKQAPSTKALPPPKDAPLLIITDGMCDVLTVRREHAYLLPGGKRLPFPTRAPVFHFGE